MSGHQICSQTQEGRITRRTGQNFNSQKVCNLLQAYHQFKRNRTCPISSTSIIEPSFYFLNNVVQVDLDFGAIGENENRESDDCTFVKSQRNRKLGGITRSFDQSPTCRRSPSTLYDNNVQNKINLWNRILLTYMRQLVSKYATMEWQLMSAKTLGPIIMVHSENEQQPRITQASYSNNRKRNPNSEVTREYSSKTTLPKQESSKRSTGRNDLSISCFSFWRNYCAMKRIWEQTDCKRETADDLRWKEQDITSAETLPMDVETYPIKDNRNQRTWTKNVLPLLEDITITSEFKPPILPPSIDTRVTSNPLTSFDKHPEIHVDRTDPKVTKSVKFSYSNPPLHSEETEKIKLQRFNNDDTRLKKSEPIEDYIECSLRARYDELRSRTLPTPRNPVYTTCAPAMAPLSSSDPILDTNGISIQLLKLAVMLYAPSLMSALNALIARCPQASIPLSYSEGTNDALTQIFNMLVAWQVTPNLQAATILDVPTSNLENYATNVSSLALNAQQSNSLKVDASLTTSEGSDGTL